MRSSGGRLRNQHVSVSRVEMVWRNTIKKKDITIGIDQGTTGTTVLAMDSSLNVLADWYGRHSQHRPGSGLLEHDPQEILASVVEGVGAVLRDLGDDAACVVAAGLANQGETVCAWDASTGEVLHNALVWSDSRGSDQIATLTETQSEQLQSITGLRPDSYFSAAKLAWMLENIPSVRQAMDDDRLAIGTTDTWLIWRLSQGSVYCTDVSTASRTMLYDLAGRRWSQHARKIMNLPDLPLAKIGPSCGDIASLSHPDWPIDNLPLRASLVDQPAALFASGCWERGQVKATYGTGCFLLVNAGGEIPPDSGRLVASVAWDLGEGPTFVVDGSVYAAGSVVEWLKEDCGWVRNAQDIDVMLADLPPRDDLLFMPALDGLSAPHWNRNVRGMVTGVTLATKPAEFIRAALDGIAHQAADLADCASASVGLELQEVRVDGGLSACSYLMQKQADLLGLPIVASENPEMTAIGVASMAGLGAGVWKRAELGDLLHQMPRRRYEPTINESERRSQRQRWQKAVELAIDASRTLL